MEPIRFAMVGGGWRAEFSLRIAKALPERFKVEGLVVRDAAKGQALEATWGVPTFRSLDSLLDAVDPPFVVTAVPADATPGFLRQLAERGVPALSETPPARDLTGLREVWALVEGGARIQVAEQYIYQPHHAARLAFAASGALGRVTQAQVSACHGYHGISLIRHYLGIGFENARIRAQRFVSPIVAGPGRDGPPAEECIVDSSQDIAWFDFGDRLGVYDFTGDQYFSWVRGQRLLVRGERGEIMDQRAGYLVDCHTPIEVEFRRMVAGPNGNLEGHYLKGIVAGEQWVYRNPFAPGRLSDDEIAVATCLAGMAEYAAGGPEVYSLADACQDRYLDIMLAEAIRSGETVETDTQPWAK